MLVKIGDKVYSSDKEPISVVFSYSERIHIAKMAIHEDILTCAPVGWQQEDLDRFNAVFTEPAPEKLPDFGLVPPAAPEPDEGVKKVVAELIEKDPARHKQAAENADLQEMLKLRRSLEKAEHAGTVQGDGVP